MFKSELIAGTGSNAVSLDLGSELPISLNFSIADIKEPDKRNGSFSKTIRLEGTKKNNKFFEHYYAVNTVTSNFNAMIYTPCYLLQEGVVVFEGNLRLSNVEIILKNGLEEITYEVEVYGDNNTLFAAIGDSKLENLDLSDYDHTYDRITQYNSWTATQGVGYVYPIIDYGYNAFATNKFKVEWLRPAIYVKYYLDKIFTAANKTYTSTFLNTAFFKRLIIPHNGDKFTMGASNQAQNEFYVGDDGTTANTNIPLTYYTCCAWSATNPITSTTTNFNCIFNKDTGGAFVDSNNLYDTSTGIITINSSGVYNLNASIGFKVRFNNTDAFTDVKPSVGGQVMYRVQILKRTNSLSPWFVFSVTPSNSYTITTNYIAQSTTYPVAGNQSNYATFTVPYNNSNLVCTAGEQMKVIFDYNYNLPSPSWTINFWNGGTKVTTGTASMDMTLTSSSTLKLSLASADYLSGQTISLNDAIPKDIKQKDFLVSIIRMFNLYVDVDPDNPDNYIIEPRDDFYDLGSDIDWSNKLSYDRPFIVKPTSEIDAKRFIYKYKDDQDYYNKQYQDSQLESYGQKTYEITNDFKKSDLKTEVIFSPTPVVDNSNNDLIIPKIFQYDGTNVKLQKHNIRILMYNGVVTNSVPWIYTSKTNDSLGGTYNTTTQLYEANMSTYAQAAMVDAPLAPNESIEFGVPNEVFYSLPTNYTTNNLFNRFYYRQVSEITDRDSKIVTAFFKLDPIDIANFDFKNRVYVRDAYYYVNKIFDYNPVDKGLTKVELVKTKRYDAFSPLATPSGAIQTNSGNTGMTARVGGLSPSDTNVGNANNVLIGDANRTFSEGSFISGEGNNVAGDTYRVNIVSCNNCAVMSNVSGVTLINCEDVDVANGVYDFVGVNLSDVSITTSDSGTVRIGEQAAPVLNYATKTADFTVDPAIQLYYIDCTAGDITATFDISTCAGMVFYFKRLDASVNLFKIDEITGLPLVDGNAIPYDTGLAQYDSITLGNNGTNFYIL